MAQNGPDGPMPIAMVMAVLQRGEERQSAAKLPLLSPLPPSKPAPGPAPERRPQRGRCAAAAAATTTRQTAPLRARGQTTRPALVLLLRGLLPGAGATIPSPSRRGWSSPPRWPSAALLLPVSCWAWHPGPRTRQQTRRPVSCPRSEPASRQDSQSVTGYCQKPGRQPKTCPERTHAPNATQPPSSRDHAPIR